MAIDFHPKAGMVLICDFSGSVMPEIGKRRPVVVVTPAHVHRVGLATIVPLSTKVPRVVLAYHHRLRSKPFTDAARVSWAKCDLVQSVSHARLSRIPCRGNKQMIGHVRHEDLVAIRHAISKYLGLDPVFLQA